MNAPFPILSWITFTPLIGALVVTFLDKRNDRAIKVVALLASLVSLALTLKVWFGFDAAKGLMFEERFAWIPSINVEYRLGVDGLSITMVLLTAIITPLALLTHWKLDRDAKLFFFLFLLLQIGIIRRVYRAEFLPLVHFLGTRPDPDVFPDQDLGRGTADVRFLQVFHLHPGGQRRHAAGIRLPVSGHQQLRFSYVARSGRFGHADAVGAGTGGRSEYADGAAHRCHLVRVGIVLGNVPRVCDQGADLAVPHLVARRPHAGADRRLRWCSRRSC